jgi:hypothetical protein
MLLEIYCLLPLDREIAVLLAKAEVIRIACSD